MASTNQKWLIGCGVGCGMVLLVTALIGGGIFFAVKDVVKEAESIDGSFEAMQEAFGEPHDFVPPVNGAVAPDRMEVFLAAREATASAAEHMAGLLYTLDDDDDGQGDSGVLAKIKAGATFIPAMLSYINERNENLLDSGMGLGEYTYIYSLAYFNYLEKDLTDGPSFQVTGDEDGQDNRGIRWNVESESDGEQLRGRREKDIRRYLHRLQASFLENQLAVAPEGQWRDALLAEQEVMASASRRILWEDDLPEAIAASLAPFAHRLDESYIPILNVIEIGMATGH
jgi:hypothetical protein